ncbi:MAG: HAD family hydrolase [Verrucomicrobiae bacterium]|nr:HAD family hydrolase [Verrucomicrobiae bacterium]
MARIRGVIFDMDGTLTEHYMDFQRLRHEMGIPTGDIVDHLMAADETERRRLDAILHRFEEDAAMNATLQPGVHELLAALRARGIKLGLLTRNSRRSVAALMARFDLGFDATVTREDGPYKPSPQPVLAIARQWGVSPAEVLVVGDYVHDLRCARDAGATGVLLINDRVPEWAKEAQHVVHKLQEVLALIDRLEENPSA